MSDVAQRLAGWVADEAEERRATDRRLRETIASLADVWAVSEADVLWLLWEGAAVTVFPRVSKIARLVDGRLEERDA